MEDISPIVSVFPLHYFNKCGEPTGVTSVTMSMQQIARIIDSASLLIQQKDTNVSQEKMNEILTEMENALVDAEVIELNFEDSAPLM